MTTPHEPESESSTPIALDDSIFDRRMLDSIADRNTAAIAAERRVLPIEMKPQYKEVPVHETVRSNPGWPVKLPPQEMKPEYDLEASARNAERFIQTNVVKREDGTLGIHTGEGGIVSLNEFFAGIGKTFYKFWDMSTQENREQSSEKISELIIKYLGEVEDEPTGTLFGDDIFSNLPTEKEQSLPVELGIFDEADHDGAVVDIGSAAYAFGQIMDAYSKANQAAHMREHSHELISKRGKVIADRIIATKTREADSALKAADRYVDILVGAEQLRAAGASEAGIDRIRKEVISVLKNKYDRTGSEVVEMRNTKRNNLFRIAKEAAEHENSDSK